MHIQFQIAKKTTNEDFVCLFFQLDTRDVKVFSIHLDSHACDHFCLLTNRIVCQLISGNCNTCMRSSAVCL